VDHLPLSRNTCHTIVLNQLCVEVCGSFAYCWSCKQIRKVCEGVVSLNVI
jgi:hypothetical protein